MPVNKISDNSGEKKALIGECITKLGKSTASQISVNKISDNSEGKKDTDKHFVRVHNQIRQVNESQKKSDIHE